MSGNKTVQNKWFTSDLDEEERTTTREELSDDTLIVRYVRLSTLFLYLSGRAFIPSLRLLQRQDAQEGLLARDVYGPFYASHHLKDHLVPFKDWLLAKARGPKVEPKPDQDPNRVELQFLSQVWLDELARRRSVWCWNIFEGDSNALWSLYGSRGVAIHSTIGLVKQAIESAGPFRCLIAAVRYPIPRRVFTEVENSSPTRKMLAESNIFRPYLFKNRAYRYEEEVRFVFGTHPDLIYEDKTMIRSPNGILINLDRPFISGISVAPEIPKDEQELIANLFSDFTSGKLSRLQYPAKDAEGWRMRFHSVGGTPFTKEDDPPGLFPDLDS